MYTIDYFIEKFSNIPEERWCVGEFENAQGQRCAQGFCMSKAEIEECIKYCTRSPEQEALIRIFNSRYLHLSSVNNGRDPQFQQKTPKQRILKALNSFK